MTDVPALRSRVVGVDALRGLAILGMFAAHVGDYGWRDREGDGWAWLWLVDGRASATFALLAGVTIALMVAGRSELTAPAPFRHTAVKIAARAIVIIGVGYVLEALGTPVIIVLMSLGTMMLMALPLARLPLPALGAVAGVFAIGGPFAVRWIAPRVATTRLHDAPVLETLWGTYYTALVWIAYVCVGMLVGRLPLTSTATLRAVGTWGFALAMLGYVVAPALGGTGPRPDAAAGHVWWLSAAAHSSRVGPHYAPAEVVGNIGVILVALAVLVWLGVRARRWLAPLAAVGSLALTVYVGQILALWALDRAVGGTGEYAAVYQPSNVTLVAFALASVGFAWAWRHWLGAGPLERLLTAAANGIADGATGGRDDLAIDDGAGRGDRSARDDGAGA